MIHINMNGYRTPAPPADEAGDRPMPADPAPAKQLAELVGPETARALIHAGWDALRPAIAQRPDLIPPGIADYIAAKVALGVAPILLAAGRKQAADAIRSAATEYTTSDARGWIREVMESDARIAEGGEPGDQ